MARPRTRDIDVATPERILASAEVAFASVGYSVATLADISRAAGLRRPSLLYHFKTKEVLYAAVVARVFARLGEALLAAQVVSGTFEARLRAVTEAFDVFLRQEPHVARIIVRELVDGDGPGGTLLAEPTGPLLDQMATWIQNTGAGQLRADLDVRVVLTHVASDALLRHAAGRLRVPLWGPTVHDGSWQVARMLLIPEEA